MKPTTEQFIRDFKSAKFYNHRLIALNLELERLENKQQWGEYKGGIRVGNTMRYAVKPFDYDTSDIIDQYNLEASKCRYEIKKVQAVDSLPLEDRNLLISVYWLNERMEDIGDRTGYTGPAIFKHIQKIVNHLPSSIW